MKGSTLGFGLCGIVIIVMAMKYSLTGNPFMITHNFDQISAEATKNTIAAVIIILSIIGMIWRYYGDETKNIS